MNESERPTKLGVHVDGLDNALDALSQPPMPPAGGGDMMGQPPMDGMSMDDGMGGQPPMDDMGGEPPMDGGNNADNEIMDIISNLSIEDQAAVKKYAKSLSDDNGGNDNQANGGSEQEPQMPMESSRYRGQIIGEKLVDKDHKRPSERAETKSPYARKPRNPWKP